VAYLVSFIILLSLFIGLSNDESALLIYKALILGKRATLITYNSLLITLLNGIPFIL
jgi:hypothetical protein